MMDNEVKRMTIRILFLCLGNICRSPMAESVFRSMVENRGLSTQIEIDSAGLGDWHLGEPPHRGTIDILTQYGYSHEGLTSRLITPDDIESTDYIVAMDEDNLKGLERLGAKAGARVFRLLDLLDEESLRNVPDPYYTGNFEEVYQLILRGCDRLLDKILADHPSIAPLR